ncbi:MAG: hypothetical protein K0S93_2360 [Nitrososphaeraceae archaeon]|jgi:mRNA-degrading endonuclease RelE of RelBE toxin-antitoxin system|nr:hypothetical protein [Nitrososphaeraceae archaeon]
MVREKPLWNFSKPSDFQDQVFALPTDFRKVLGRKMNELAYSEFPNKIGDKKITKYGEIFTIDVNDSYRLAFSVDFLTKTITIIRLGDHKEVYGKDK